MNSPLAKLMQTPVPVDGNAVKVAFRRGEHHTAPKRKGEHRIKTWRVMPAVIGTPPVGEFDWTAQRNGRMQVVCWYRPGRKGRPSIWLCRCDCGNYEARVPACWNDFLPKRWHGNDACEKCKDRDVLLKRAGESRAESHIRRRNAWIKRLLAEGVPVTEIAAALQKNSVLTPTVGRGTIAAKESESSEHSGTRTRQSLRFFCARPFSMAGRATDTTPRKGEEVHRLCSAFSLPATPAGSSESDSAGFSNLAQESLT